MHNSSIKRHHGITLLELMIVVTIIVIMSIIALPNYSDYLYRARRADAMQSLENIRILQEKWRRNHTTYGTTAQIRNDGNTSGNWLSQESHYILSATAPSATGFTVTATPQGKQVGDTCGVFTINQDGPVYGTAPANADADCWRD